MCAYSYKYLALIRVATYRKWSLTYRRGNRARRKILLSARFVPGHLWTRTLSVGKNSLLGKKECINVLYASLSHTNLTGPYSFSRGRAMAKVGASTQWCPLLAAMSMSSTTPSRAKGKASERAPNWTRLTSMRPSGRWATMCLSLKT